MNTFTFFEGTTYTRKDNGYCFVEQNGKKTRISKAEFEEAERIYNTYHANGEAKLDAAAENPEISLEEFVGMIEDAEEASLTKEIEHIIDEMVEVEEGNRVVLEPAEFNEHGMVICMGCPYAKTCKHREAHRRNPVDAGGLGLCPRLALGRAEEPKAEEPIKDPTPKAKKSRASKNAAFKLTHDGKEVTLTEKQVDFIKHLPDTCFWENGLDSCIWVDCLCDEIGGQFKGKPMTVGAMVSTLCEKDLGCRAQNRVNGKKCTSFALTELGKVVAAELGLN